MLQIPKYRLTCTYYLHAICQTCRLAFMDMFGVPDISRARGGAQRRTINWKLFIKPSVRPMFWPTEPQVFTYSSLRWLLQWQVTRLRHILLWFRTIQAWYFVKLTKRIRWQLNLNPHITDLLCVIRTWCDKQWTPRGQEGLKERESMQEQMVVHNWSLKGRLVRFAFLLEAFPKYFITLRSWVFYISHQLHVSIPQARVDGIETLDPTNRKEKKYAFKLLNTEHWVYCITGAVIDWLGLGLVSCYLVSLFNRNLLWLKTAFSSSIYRAERASRMNT